MSSFYIEQLRNCKSLPAAPMGTVVSRSFDPVVGPRFGRRITLARGAEHIVLAPTKTSRAGQVVHYVIAGGLSVKGTAAELRAMRKAAKESRDYALADAIEAELKSEGQLSHKKAKGRKRRSCSHGH